MNNNKKIALSDYILEDLIDKRYDSGLSAYALSEKLGKSKFWISNFENKKVKYISRSDLESLYSFLLSDDNFDLDNYLNSLQEKKDTQLNESWLKTGNILNKYIGINNEDDLGDIYGDLVEELHDDLIDMYEDIISLYKYESTDNKEYNLHMKKVLISALSELCSSLRNEPDLTALLMSIPLSVTTFLTPEERHEIKKDLLVLYQKCITIFDEKTEEIQHAEEMNKLQKQNLQYIGCALSAKVDEFNSLTDMSDSYSATNMKFLSDTLKILSSMRTIPERNMSFDSLDALFEKCIEYYKKACTKYNIKPSIPDNPLSNNAHTILREITIKSLEEKTEPSE